MHLIRKRRLYWVVLLLAGLGLAAFLVLYALKQNINLFFTPSQLFSQHLPEGYRLRLGGMVKLGSVRREANSLKVNFVVMDRKAEWPVEYTGILPDLFKEGSGMVAEGHLNPQGVFVADQVLAKHDEKYMPKALYDAMRKEQG